MIFTGRSFLLKCNELPTPFASFQYGVGCPNPLGDHWRLMNVAATVANVELGPLVKLNTTNGLRPGGNDSLVGGLECDLIDGAWETEPDC